MVTTTMMTMMGFWGQGKWPVIENETPFRRLEGIAVSRMTQANVFFVLA